MKRGAKLTLTTTIGVVVVGIGAFAVRGHGNEPVPSVEVVRDDLVDRAVAIGTIQPETEISVKSKVSGVVRRAYVEPGVYVHAGDPLLEIRPDPTPVELVEARRQLELRQNDMDAVERERDRQHALFDRKLLSQKELDDIERRFVEAQLQLKMAREKLSLLETGKLSAGGSQVETLVRSPVTGYVLERMVEVGDPIVPLSTYQEGTVLFTMADMSRLVFKGTVDEIDVGRLKEGMPADIKIGALPQAHVTGSVSRISLKAQKDETATVFPIEITVKDMGGARLRAGFSANAEVIIDQRKGVLVIPERVVNFDGDSAWVEVPGTAEGERVRRTIKTGLSDAISVEVLDGLKEGEKVLEKPVKTVK